MIEFHEAARPRRRWPLIVLIALLLVAVGVAVSTFAGYRYAEHTIAPARRPVRGLTKPTAGKPVNVLLLGSDTREGMSAEELRRAGTGHTGGQRADTIMVLHVSPGRRQVVMLSIPRDLKVDAGGHPAKINAAFAGDADRLVATVEHLTGLEINHFVEVNFGGFIGLVDDLGGVTLCNDSGHRLDDADANLHMDPGCHLVDGPGALAFVRARKVDSDYGRIRRQQQFVRAVMREATGDNTLTDLPRLTRIGRELAKQVRTDDGTSVAQALDLVRKLGQLRDDEIDMRTYPSDAPSPACRGCPAYVVARPEAPLLTRAIGADSATLPPIGRTGQVHEDPTLAGVGVRVLAAGDPDAARALRDRLRGLGLPATYQGRTTTNGTPITIRYGPARKQEAGLLAGLLDGTPPTVPDPAAGRSLTVVAGG